MSAPITHRPKDFDTFIGNQETVEQLQSIFKGKRKDIPNAFLFCGPSGCGKTTLARITAKYLECSDFDFKEFDIADNRGIDTAREIKQTAFLKPMQGKTKIYLLDECHQATKDFQNAILKLIEEPPTGVYFILCSTEPEKLIPTIRTRCSIFTVTALSSKRIKKILSNVAKIEEVVLSEEVSDMIAKSSNGSGRNALLLYDQVKGVDPENQIKGIQATIKNEKNIYDLCRALLDNKVKWKVIADIISVMEDEPEKIRRSVLGYFTKVALSGDSPRAILIIDAFKENYFNSGKAGLVLSAYQLFL
jgi:DNA polymerase III subunit gamma/tau